MLNSDWITRAVASFLGGPRLAMNEEHTEHLAMWKPLQFAVAVERVITSFTLGMDGHPTFKKFFYFTLGIGAFAVIISVSCTVKELAMNLS